MRGSTLKTTAWILFAVMLPLAACIWYYQLRPYTIPPTLSLQLGKSTDQKRHFALKVNGIPLRLTKERLTAMGLPIALTHVDETTERGFVEHYTNGITVRREENGNAESISVYFVPRYGGRPVTFHTDVGITKDTEPNELDFDRRSPLGSPSRVSGDENGARVYFRDDDGYSILFAFAGRRIYMVSIIAP